MLLEIILSGMILYAIVYVAVSFAIKPLLNEKNISICNDEDLELLELRDIEVISDDEFDDIIKILQDKQEKQKNYKKYQHYANVLKELRDIEYFSEKDYFLKMDKLKEFYNMKR
ncbi:hypothetical protein [Anaerovorax odorimutans]|uniref:hypothetical protein n=1 Tax=Anaerovorax odorimutans TaxID=109327 RepID=UPI00041AF741|nr:hypothetical protein [Anaerovorax odorimutans]